jgi:hypothetical protein
MAGKEARSCGCCVAPGLTRAPAKSSEWGEAVRIVAYTWRDFEASRKRPATSTAWKRGVRDLNPPKPVFLSSSLLGLSANTRVLTGACDEMRVLLNQPRFPSSLLWLGEILKKPDGPALKAASCCAELTRRPNPSTVHRWLVRWSANICNLRLWSLARIAC